MNIFCFVPCVKSTVNFSSASSVRRGSPSCVDTKLEKQSVSVDISLARVTSHALKCHKQSSQFLFVFSGSLARYFIVGGVVGFRFFLV